VTRAADRRAENRLLVILDIDGTVLHDSGELSDRVVKNVRRLADRGDEVTIATGRSVSSTLPVLEQLGIAPEFVVCSNGAITLQRDADAPMGYRREFVETFDPTVVLQTIRGHLADAVYAVEDETGFYRYTEAFPETAIGLASERVDFEGLLGKRVTRVVVISPDHEVEDFLSVVEQMGLHRVSYNVGWTAWLDIAPDGVNKATAMERVRDMLGIPITNVIAVGDGRNDIELLQWAGRQGRGVAMGQAPHEVIAASSETTAPVTEDGLAKLLAEL